ncbi:urease accessory protein [Rhizobiales bacterium GAS113]|nr:urease accessory protein [Rhizobiales bacterium GAS113]
MASERISQRCRPPSSPKEVLTAATATITTLMIAGIIMNDEQCHFQSLALLRLQSWLSPAFPTGAYSYSHGLEWAVEAKHIHDRKSLVDWMEADLCYGSGRNEAIFFSEAWRCAIDGNRAKLLEIAELAAAFRGTSEFALESSQQAMACLVTLRQVWPDGALDWLSEILSECHVRPALAVVLGVRSARQGIPASLALPAFLQSYVANLVTAAVRLIPLGQTDGQLAIAALEETVLAASARAKNAAIDDLGSAAFMVDLASMAHETQYTRLFRS